MSMDDYFFYSVGGGIPGRGPVLPISPQTVTYSMMHAGIGYFYNTSTFTHTQDITY